MQGGCAQRGHQPNGAWHRRQWPFADSVKQAKRLQLGLDLEELLKQVALTGTRHALNNQLQVTAWLVHAKAANHLNQFAITWRKSQASRGPLEHGAAQLAGLVFQ